MGGGKVRVAGHSGVHVGRRQGFELEGRGR